MTLALLQPAGRTMLSITTKEDYFMQARSFTTRNGEEIGFTSLGFGSAPLGNMFEKLDEKTAIATVETAFERGIRLFDTSPNYGAGLAEARTAAGLRGSPRDAFILSTKVGRVLDPFGRRPEARSGAELFATGYPHVRRFDYSYDGAMRSIEQSLLRLGMDRLDIVLIHDCDRLIHGDDAPIRFREAMEGCYVALDKLRSEKVIKAIGFGLNEADSCAKFAKEGDFDAGMMAGRYSLLDQSGLSEFLPIAEAKNIAVMLAGVFNSGILATGAIPNAKFGYADATPEILDKVAKIEALCCRHGVTIRQAALRFAASHPAVYSVVLGAVKPQEVIENVQDAAAVIPGELWSDLKFTGLLDPGIPVPV